MQTEINSYLRLVFPVNEETYFPPVVNMRSSRTDILCSMMTQPFGQGL